MDGVKEFLNKGCEEITVKLFVRAGDQPGCIYNTEEFNLKPHECKKIVYGNACNPYIDGISVYHNSLLQYTETTWKIKGCGSPMDHFINSHKRIIFLNAGRNLIISGEHD